MQDREEGDCTAPLKSYGAVRNPVVLALSSSSFFMTLASACRMLARSLSSISS